MQVTNAEVLFAIKNGEDGILSPRRGINNTSMVIRSFGGQFLLFSPFVKLFLEMEFFFF